ESRYSLAMETALGGAMQNLVVENEAAAKDWIRYLAAKRAGRATFLPLTSVRGQLLSEQAVLQEDAVIDLASNLVRYDAKFTNVIHALLGRIIIAEHLDSATELAKRYGYRFRIVTLDGQVINAGGSFTGGSAQKRGGMLTRKQELVELQRKMHTLQEQVRQDTAQWEQQKADYSRKTEHLQQLQNQLHIKHAEQLLAAAAAEAATKQLSQLQTQWMEQQQQRKALTEQIAALQQQHRTAKSAWEQTQVDLTEAKTIQQQAKQEQETVAAEQAKISQILTERQIAAAKLEQEIVSRQQNQTEQQARLDNCREQKQHLKEEKIACEQQQTILQQQEKELQTRLADCKQRMTADREQITKLQRVHTEQEQQIRQRQDGIRECSAAKERTAAAVTQLETKQHDLEQQRDRIVQQMREQYDVTLSEAGQLAEPIRDTVLAKQQLESLRRQIRALGNVNVSAIEEYQQVSEQWQFLSAQLKDATEAKQELETLIVRLTAEMQRIFTERFAGINQAFQEIFRELFDGGEASLELSDPEDVLHSGIEIRVAPPGKVIKNLIALSGGEQSFVAIAIYFAILRQHPTPFCIMDEIDAALDEGNVRRYVQYLQHFQKTTQFILITHRRMAMEAADALYGVTMQEDGISRLLHMEQISEHPDTLA
ncbi:MAG: chromosome segregation protein SMC, partial [Ruminococcus sp.]